MLSLYICRYVLYIAIYRGDLQYKGVKVTTEELLDNVGFKLKKGQLLYIATDVRDKAYFDAMLTDFPNVSL